MLVNMDTGTVIAYRIFIAQNFWHRLRGLQLKRSIPDGYAYIIPHCSSIHTCFMRFDLDVIFVDAEWRVLKIYKRLKPFRFTKPLKTAHAAIELRLAHLQIEPGQILALISDRSDCVK